MAALLRKYKSIRSSFFSTRTKSDVRQLEQRRLLIEPTALYCYSVGRNITSQLDPRHIWLALSWTKVLTRNSKRRTKK
jgi:hypothetical protein